MWAMQAKARYFDRLNDLLGIMAWQHMDKEQSRAFSARIAMLASGPGRLVPWEETLSPELRQAIADVDREVAETIARRRAGGTLKPESEKGLGRRRKKK